MVELTKRMIEDDALRFSDINPNNVKMLEEYWGNAVSINGLSENVNTEFRRLIQLGIEEVVILFSGGIDSTMLAYHASHFFEKITLLHIECNATPLRAHEEYQSAGNIYRVLQRSFPEVQYNFKRANLTLAITFQEDVYSPQPIQWMFEVLRHINPSVKKDAVLIGYNYEDTGGHLFPAMQKSFLSLQDMSFVAPHRTSLVAPLLSQHRAGIMGRLPWNLLKLTSWCELPIVLDGEKEIRPCGNCPTCSKMRVEKTLWEATVAFREQRYDAIKPVPVIENDM